MEPVNPLFDDGKTTEAAASGRAAGPREADVAVAPASARPDEVGSAGEVRVEGRGRTWWARMAGRSGRANAGAPLLLLRFRGEGDTAPTLEALVAGRSLEDLPEEVLATALARAVEPLPAGRRRPFFEEAGDARRT